MNLFDKAQLAQRRLNDAQAVLNNLKPKRKDARRNRKDSIEALQFVQHFCQTIQEQTYGKISELVTTCLRAVFDQPYQFKIIFDKKRNKAEARPVFLRGKNEFDPISECGGGVVDVAAFALRLAGLRPLAGTVRQTMFLDEPGKHLSKAYRPRFAKLLEALSQELKIQLIVITHSEEMASGKVISIPNSPSQSHSNSGSNQRTVPKIVKQVPSGPKSRRR